MKKRSPLEGKEKIVPPTAGASRQKKKVIRVSTYRANDFAEIPSGYSQVPVGDKIRKGDLFHMLKEWHPTSSVGRKVDADLAYVRRIRSPKGSAKPVGRSRTKRIPNSIAQEIAREARRKYPIDSTPKTPTRGRKAAK